MGIYEVTHGDDILTFEEALHVNRDFFKIAYMPAKWTLLHRFTLCHSWQEWNYLRRKTDEEFITQAGAVLEHFMVGFTTTRHRETADLKHYLFGKLQEPLREIAHEVFCILFNNKDLMRRFSERVAEAIADACPTQYPAYLHSKGRLKRASYWPIWLRDALFYRENGMCAECTNSLTGVIDPSLKPQIDHIVPIANGGTTDPTNLQVLCEPCNKKKGNSSNQVGKFIYVPWLFREQPIIVQ